MNPDLTRLRQQLRQLQALHDDGTLSAEAWAQARAPLEARLADLEAGGDAGDGAARARPGRGLSVSLVLGVLALAVAGYAWRGSPRESWLGSDAAIASAEAAASAAAAEAAPTAEQMNRLVEQLAERMKEKPEDPVGWAMLGRAYSAMGRPADAVPAFRQALERGGESAGLLADYADALATVSEGKLDGEPTRLVQRALALDPNHLKALALAGSIAFDTGDFRTAVERWERVAQALPADSPFLGQVRASIAQARERGGLGSAPAGPASAPALASAAPAPAAAGSTGVAGPGAAAPAVSGRITLAPALAARIQPTDTVFVVARAAEGPRMPLAVLRRPAGDLPFDYRLDDSLAMSPEFRLSGQTRVVVVARISRSGNALPQPGDLSGQSAPVAPGASGVAVEIGSVVE